MAFIKAKKTSKGIKYYVVRGERKQGKIKLYSVLVGNKEDLINLKENINKKLHS